MRATETPVALAIVANVSPARTDQNRCVDFAIVVVRPPFAGLASEPDSKPARISTTASVAASRNAAGAT
jgi:hypothetical protein